MLFSYEICETLWPAHVLHFRIVELLDTPYMLRPSDLSSWNPSTPLTRLSLVWSATDLVRGRPGDTPVTLASSDPMLLAGLKMGNFCGRAGLSLTRLFTSKASCRQLQTATCSNMDNWRDTFFPIVPCRFVTGAVDEGNDGPGSTC